MTKDDMPIYPYYELKIYIDTEVVSQDIIKKYTEKISAIQKQMESYKTGDNLYMDAGFDLFSPNTLGVSVGSRSVPISQGIKCAMTFNNIPTAFHLYPRSSTGSKTPLRLANSVGIIDSGYRGHIISIFDYVGNNPSAPVFVVNEGDRLVQICGPNIMYPIYPILVYSVEELGLTKRGNGGFGSTGR